MDRSCRQLILAFMMLVALVPASAGQSRPAGADIKRFMNTFIVAVTSGDAKQLAPLFADDATVFYPSPPFVKGRVSGRSDIETTWQQAFASGRPDPKAVRDDLQHALEHAQIQIYGDIAILTLELDLGNPPRLGRRTFVLQHTGETWRIVHAHSSNRAE
jgi:ketosteroid isomerase-like protein